MNVDQLNARNARNTISRNWSSAAAYLSVLGISGTIQNTLSNKVWEISNEPHPVRAAELARPVADVVAKFAEALQAFHALTPSQHDEAAAAAAHLRSMALACSDLTHAATAAA